MKEYANIKTPRTDELDARAAQHASDDMPFDDAMRLCEDLEEKLEMAKFWMQKVCNYYPPRKKDLSRMQQCLNYLNSNDKDSHQTNEHSN